MSEDKNILENESETERLGFFQKHWRGELPLRKSFWISYVFLNMLFNYVTNRIHAHLPQDDLLMTSRLAISWAIFALFVFYPWQLIGLWRASNRQIESKKGVVAANVVKGIIIITLLFILANISMKGSLEDGSLKHNFEVSILRTNKEAVEYSLKAIAEEINETLPKQLDDVTTYTNVESSGLTLKYFYVVDISIEEVDRVSFHKQLTSQLGHNHCFGEDLPIGFVEWVTYVYNYQDKNGLLIDELKFDKSDCP